VDTIVRPPDTGGTAAIVPPRRWLRVVILAVVGTVAALATLGSIWIANYAPLVQGSTGFGTLRRDVKEVDVDAFDMRGTGFTVPTGRTATFRYRFSILNEGPVAVRIDSVGTPLGEDGSLRRAIRVVPDLWADDGGTGPPREEPWHPFTLPSGGEAVVVMEAAYDGRCISRGESIGWYWEPVSFSIFGISRNDIIESGVEVRFIGDGSCGTS
jgi:hypothetical protein